MSHPTLFDLTGRVILVTGAGRGIGAATALALARQGATLVVSDLDPEAARRSAAALSAEGARAEAWPLDVTSPAHWQAAIAHIEATHGRLDALVNNAGMMVTVPFMETTLAEFDQSLHINARSVFLGVQAAVPLLARTCATHGTKPSIVNLSSLYGNLAGPAHVACCASKGAVRTMSKAMAVELAPQQIRVNSVHPGPVDTDLLAGALDSLVQRGRMPGGDKARSIMAKSHPMGRTAVPADVAGVIAFLCSDAASFMTGAELTVDGGYGLL